MPHTQELTAPSTHGSPGEVEHWRNFGRWLRAARMERSRLTGLPRAELAKVCGVHDNSWANWERGGRNVGGQWVVYRPKYANLHGIAVALDLPAAEVFSRAARRMEGDALVAPFDPASLLERIAALEARLDALVASA